MNLLGCCRLAVDGVGRVGGDGSAAAVGSTGALSSSSCPRPAPRRRPPPGRFLKALRRSCQVSRSPGLWGGLRRPARLRSSRRELRTRFGPRSTGDGNRAWRRSWPCDGVLCRVLGSGVVSGRVGIVPPGSGPVESARGTSGLRRSYSRRLVDATRCGAATLTTSTMGGHGTSRYARTAAPRPAHLRHRIAATSAARIACPRKCSVATMRSCPRTRS